MSWATLSLREAEALAAELGTPYFHYDRAVLLARAEAVKRVGVRVLYAMKANPHADVLRALVGKVDGLDVASPGELELALSTGWPGSSLSFTGPGKTEASLARALSVGALLNLESMSQLNATARLVRDAGVDARISLRLNPTTTFRAFRVPMTGMPSPFGFDEEALDEVLAALKREPSLRLESLHVHGGAQCTSVGALGLVVETALTLLERVRAVTGLPVTRVNVGGGWGAIGPGDELDVRALGERVASLVDVFAAKTGVRVEVTVEPGRWLVGPAGLYVTRVVSEKTSRGVRFVVLDGGIHHFLSASTLMLPAKAARAEVLNLSAREARREACSLVGSLCTPLDALGEVELSRPEVGHLLAFQCAGAYGPTFSPSRFLGHSPAAERLSQ